MKTTVISQENLQEAIRKAIMFVSGSNTEPSVEQIAKGFTRKKLVGLDPSSTEADWEPYLRKAVIGGEGGIFVDLRQVDPSGIYLNSLAPDFKAPAGLENAPKQFGVQISHNGIRGIANYNLPANVTSVAEFTKEIEKRPFVYAYAVSKGEITPVQNRTGERSTEFAFETLQNGFVGVGTMLVLPKAPSTSGIVEDAASILAAAEEEQREKGFAAELELKKAKIQAQRNRLKGNKTLELLEEALTLETDEVIFTAEEAAELGISASVFKQTSFGKKAAEALS